MFCLAEKLSVIEILLTLVQRTNADKDMLKNTWGHTLKFINVNDFYKKL